MHVTDARECHGAGRAFIVSDGETFWLANIWLTRRMDKSLQHQTCNNMHLLHGNLTMQQMDLVKVQHHNVKAVNTEVQPSRQCFVS